jgi:hypothetical protein
MEGLLESMITYSFTRNTFVLAPRLTKIRSKTKLKTNNMPKTDIEWLEATNKLKEQRDLAISIAKRLNNLSNCSCNTLEHTHELLDTKKALERLELETCEYPLHWGGVEPSETLKKLFNTDQPLFEAKVFELKEENKEFINNCVNDNRN